MTQVAYKQGMRYEDEKIILTIHKTGGRFYASITKKDSLELVITKRYSTISGLNNSIKKFGIEIM